MKKPLAKINKNRKGFMVKLSPDELDYLSLARGILGVSMSEIIRYATFRIYLPSVLKKDQVKKS